MKNFGFIFLLLTALSALLVVRLGNFAVGFSDASAQSDGTEKVAPMTSSPDDARNLQTVSAPLEALPETERRILERLSARRKELDAREKTLEEREVLIAAAEKALEDKVAAYERQRTQLDADLKAQESAEEKNLDTLVSAYEKMKARDAAAIFDSLDDDVMVSVALRMRTQSLASVMAEMNTDRARFLTVALAKSTTSIDRENR